MTQQTIPPRFLNWVRARYNDEVKEAQIIDFYRHDWTPDDNVAYFKEHFGRTLPVAEPTAVHTKPQPQSKYAYLFQKPKIIGVVADVNQGKSMLLYNIIEDLRQAHRFSLYYYGLREDIEGAQRVSSVAEMEKIKNSIIIIDELPSLFDLDNRKVKAIIENSLRLINHNNNVMLLAGVPENFKKFLSGKIDVLFLKRASLADFINGSRVKNIVMDYRGNEKGSAVLNLDIDEALMYDGQHYKKIRVDYIEKYDTKRVNESVLKKV
jgi:hypothetical protein